MMDALQSVSGIDEATTMVFEFLRRNEWDLLAYLVRNVKAGAGVKYFFGAIGTGGMVSDSLAC
jgi:hypothetical protein